MCDLLAKQGRCHFLQLICDIQSSDIMPTNKLIYIWILDFKKFQTFCFIPEINKGRLRAKKKNNYSDSHQFYISVLQCNRIKIFDCFDGIAILKEDPLEEQFPKVITRIFFNKLYIVFIQSWNCLCFSGFCLYSARSGPALPFWLIVFAASLSEDAEF